MHRAMYDWRRNRKQAETLNQSRLHYQGDKNVHILRSLTNEKRGIVTGWDVTEQIMI